MFISLTAINRIKQRSDTESNISRRFSHSGFHIACGFEKGGYCHNAPSRHFSIGLGCNITQAKKMIYSDGMELTNTAQIVPIGVGCRICPRMECEQRAHPPADHRFRINDNERAESLYGRIG